MKHDDLDYISTVYDIRKIAKQIDIKRQRCYTIIAALFFGLTLTGLLILVNL